MIMIIAYCIDRNMEIVAGFLSQAPLNSTKASTNPSLASLNRFSYYFNVRLETNFRYFSFSVFHHRWRFDRLSHGDLFLPNSPQLVLLKAVNRCKVLVLHERYTPVYPNWYLRETRIHLHYWSNPRDTTEGLQEVTYSPGKHSHSPLVPSNYFLMGELASQRTSISRQPYNWDNLLLVLCAKNLMEGMRSISSSTFKASTSNRCTARGSWVAYRSLIFVA